MIFESHEEILKFRSLIKLIDPKLSPTINELPEGLQILAQMNQVEQGNYANPNKKLTDNFDQGSFDWSSSNEGIKFWVETDIKYGIYPSLME